MEGILYNQTGKKQGTTPLPKEVFDVKESPDLMHQVITSQMANRRQVIAHTKDRGDVSGGGRKPWRQKGTGRARHGSNRSPIWRGGGVTFGPTNARNFKKKIPTTMKRQALAMALTAKAQDNFLILLDQIKIKEIKTRDINNLLLKLPCKDDSVLVVLPENDKNIILSCRNVINLDVVQAKDLNALDVLSFKYLLMPQESIKVIEETFFKKQ